MKIYFAADHAGFEMKNELVKFVKELDFEVEDCGAYEFDKTDDYPDYAIPLARAVAAENGRGILICKNGVGVCITANKVKGVRAGIGYNLMAAETMVADDDANVLCLASKLSSDDHALAIVKLWLATEADRHERHVRRRAKVAALEK